MSFDPAEVELIEKLSAEAADNFRRDMVVMGHISEDARLPPVHEDKLLAITRRTLQACMKMINEEVPKIQRDIDSRNKEQS